MNIFASLKKINKAVVAAVVVAVISVGTFIGCQFTPPAPGETYRPSPAVAVVGTAAKFSIVFLHKQVAGKDFDMAVDLIKVFRSSVTDNSTVQLRDVLVTAIAAAQAKGLDPIAVAALQELVVNLDYLFTEQTAFSVPDLIYVIDKFLEGANLVKSDFSVASDAYVNGSW